jgi:hypothetical protein
MALTALLEEARQLAAQRRHLVCHDREMRRLGRAALLTGAVLALTSLVGCAPTNPDPAAVAKDRDPGLYSGPLLGAHELLDSVEISNPTKQPIRLLSATPTKPYNIRVDHAWAGPIHAPDGSSDSGILGVLRWPRPSTEKKKDDEVLGRLRPVDGFMVPAKSRDQSMITLQLRQQDPAQSMRTTGTTVTYTLNGQKYSVSIPTALCFFTSTDANACPAYKP